VNATLPRLLRVSDHETVETKDLQSRQEGLDVVGSVDQERDSYNVSDDVG